MVHCQKNATDNCILYYYCIKKNCTFSAEGNQIKSNQIVFVFPFVWPFQEALYTHFEERYLIREVSYLCMHDFIQGVIEYAPQHKVSGQVEGIYI